MIEAILFWCLAIGTVLGALVVVVPPFGRNPVHGALGLIGSFFCLSGLYVMLCAHLLAALQVIVYAGAIMVLFTFVIMLLNLTPEELGNSRFTVAKGIGVLAIGLVLAKVVKVLETPQTDLPVDLTGTTPDDYGGIVPVGTVLLRDFLLPFELTSILLLVAVVGAVIIARKQGREAI